MNPYDVTIPETASGPDAAMRQRLATCAAYRLEMLEDRDGHYPQAGTRSEGRIGRLFHHGIELPGRTPGERIEVVAPDGKVRFTSMGTARPPSGRSAAGPTGPWCTERSPA